MNVAVELLAEESCAWLDRESGDVGRLWWLPGPLIPGMKDISVVVLCDGDLVIAERLVSLIDAIRRVKWSLLDPK